MDLDIMKMVTVWREDLMKGMLLSNPKLEEGRLLGSQFLSLEIGRKLWLFVPDQNKAR